MSDEEQINLEQREAELWREVNRSSGAERAKGLAALSGILWGRGDYKYSLVFCESARDLYLEAGRENYLDEITDVNFGIMNNADMLGRNREAAEAAGEVIKLYKETDHPMLGELLRDQGRFWFRIGEDEKSLACHLEAVALVNPDETEDSRATDLLNIAMANRRLAHYQDAIAGLTEAIEIFKKEKDPKSVAKCHGEFAQIYLGLEMADEILEWSRKALDYAELVGDHRWEYILNYFFGVAYKLKDDIESAEEYLAKAKHLVAQYGAQDWESIVSIEREIAGIQMIRGLVDTAQETLRRVATIEETLLAS